MYRSQHTGTIADLIMRRGQARAQADQASSQAWANGIGQLGQIAGGTIASLARIKQDEPRQKLEAAKMAEQTQGLEGQRLLRELITSNTDPETNRTNYSGVANELRTAGHGDLAESVTQRWQGEQSKALNDLAQRVNSHKTIFGQGAQLLQEAKTRPDLYPQIRPKLVDMASTIDPRLGAEIPETFDPAQIDGMIQFASSAVADADRRARGLETLKQAHATTDDAVKREGLHRKALSDWYATVTSSEDKQAVDQAALEMGIDPSVVQSFGEWDDSFPKRAALAGMTPAERTKATAAVDDVKGSSDFSNILRAVTAKFKETKGRNPTGNDRLPLLQEAKRIDAMFRRNGDGSGDGVDTATVQANVDAVLTHPQLWNQPGITQTMRTKMIPLLNAQGFQFPKGGTTDDSAIKYRTSARASLAKEFRASQKNPLEAMTPEDRERGFREIEDTYRKLTGQDPISDEEWPSERMRILGPAMQGPIQPATDQLPNKAQLGTGDQPETGRPQRLGDISLDSAGNTPAPPRSGPPPAPPEGVTAPRVGERRRINGKLAEWATIGGQSGWVEVK